MKQRLSLLTLAVVVVSQLLFAVPARRGWKDYLTDKGESVTLQMIGDEFGHWLEDSQGVAYRLLDDGTVALSEKTAEQLGNHRKASPRYRASRPQRTAGNINLAPRGIVILVNYKNLSMQSSNTQAAFNDMMNKAGYNYRNTHNSVREYFREQSRGQYVPDFDVYGPVTIKNNYSYYGANDSNGDDMYPGDIVVEAVKAVDEQYDVDFSLYNNNGDNEIDFVYILYAGKGEADGGAANTIWPHNWDVSSARSYGNCTYSASQCKVDGLYINNYAMSGELDGYTGYRNSIGTICHEFGHVLGLPDLYDTSYGSNYNAKVTPNNYDIMDGGSYNGADSDGTLSCGTCPPNYSPFERMYLGWDTPVNPGKIPSNLVLYPAEHSDYKCYQINASGEYQVCTTQGVNYYIENRQKTGWDTYLPGHGMLVWKVNYNATYWLQNKPNHSDYGSPHCTLVSAYGTKLTSGANTYPGTQNVTEWTSLASRPVTSIAESGGIVTAAYMGGAVEHYNKTLAYYTAINNETVGKDGDYSVYLYDSDHNLVAIAEIYTQDNYSLSGTFAVGVDGGATSNSLIYLNEQYYDVTFGEISFQYVGKSSNNEDIYQVTATDWYIPSLDIIYDMSGTIYGNAVWKTPFVECGRSTTCDGVIIDIDNHCGDHLTWNLSSDNTVLTIEGYGAMYDFTFTDASNNTIPWFDARNTIRQVVMPEGMTSIGNFAFWSCQQIVSADIPSTVMLIGQYAFGGVACNSIILPDNLTIISSYAFVYCNNINSIIIPEKVASIGKKVFYSCANLRTVVWNAKNCTSTTTLIDVPFYDVRSQITSFTMGDKVRTIPNGLCYGMSQLTSVNISESVTTIGEVAFAECSGLTSITIPKNVSSINKNPFYNTNIQSVIWNAKNCATVSARTYTPFYDIRSQITSFTFGNTVQTIPGALCYGMNNLSSITIPNSVQTVNVWAFADMTNLTSVQWGTGVKTVGRKAFEGCTKLSSITIPSSLTLIKDSVFNGCTSLNTVNWDANSCSINGETAAYTPFYSVREQITIFNIGNNVTLLPIGCCLGMTNLTSVELPAGMSTINNNAFNLCPSLTSITFNQTTPPTLSGSYCFANGASERTAYVPCGRKLAYVVSPLPFTTYDTFGSDFPFTLTVNVQTEGTGSVTITDEPDCGTNVAELTATNAEHYHFVRWLDEDANAVSVGAVRNVTLTNNSSYTAIFEEDDHITLTVSSAGNGTAAADKDWYYPGETATITISPAAHYHFSAWTGEDASNISQTDATTFTYLVGTTDRTFTVAFAEDTKYTLTLNNDGHGTASADKAEYYEGETATITISPAEHYHFGSWTGEDASNISQTNATTFTYDVGTTDREFTVAFAEDTKYTLTLNNDGHGTASADKAEYYEGETATITISPAEHYHFGSWTGDDASNISQTNATTFTYTVGTENSTFTANFAEDTKYTLTINNDGHGTASANKAEYYEGETATITISPAEHYHFGSWTGDDVSNISQTNATTFTYFVGTTNREFTVAFAEDCKYTLTLNNDGHGTASADKDSYYEGETAYITISPATHYHYSAWTGEDVSHIKQTDDTHFTYKVGTINRTFTANFEIDNTGGGNCEENNGTNLTWAFADGTLTITGTGNMENYSNDTDMPWYDYMSQITTVSLADGADQTPLLAKLVSAGAKNIQIRRTLYADGCYNTLCLPFDLSATQIATFLPHARLCGFTGASIVNGELNIQLQYLSEVTAGEPFLIFFPAVDNDIINPTFNNVEITRSNGISVGTGDVRFVGVLKPEAMTKDNENQLMMGADNTLFWADRNANMYGYRAYFDINTSAGSPIRRGMPARVSVRTETPTGLGNDSGTTAETTEKRIENGQLVIIRNGRKYTAQGQRAE